MSPTRQIRSQWAIVIAGLVSGFVFGLGALTAFTAGRPVRLAGAFQSSGWIPLTSGVTSDLRSVHFLNESEGWVAGANATLLHTTNGGSDWSPVNTGVDAANGFNAVRAIDQNTIWAGVPPPSAAQMAGRIGAGGNGTRRRAFRSKTVFSPSQPMWLGA